MARRRRVTTAGPDPVETVVPDVGPAADAPAPDVAGEVVVTRALLDAVPSAAPACRHTVMRYRMIGKGAQRHAVKRCDDCGYERPASDDGRPYVEWG